MKRVLTILLVLAITLLIVRANAQGRGNGAEGKGHKHGWKNDRYEKHAGLDNCAIDHHHHSVRTIAHHPARIFDHSHRRDHRHGRAHVRQEYVYYCDYDFYYDPERRVYITLSGGRWRVSASLPIHVRRSDLHRADRHEVVYFGDDFPRYLSAGDHVAYVRR